MATVPKHKVVLVVIDGWGYAPAGPGNFVEAANTPVIDSLLSKYPYTLNKASGNAVGLPEGTQGNSEVGHLHIGAGRVVWQAYERINRAIKSGEFFTNKKLTTALENVKKQGSSLHLIGLCSDAGVHAHIDHLIATLDLANRHGIKNIFIHFIADGRDVAEKSALEYIKKIKDVGIGKIATVCGRYFAMDRDNNWDRTQAAYDSLIDGVGEHASSPEEAVEKAYARGDKTDYYISPMSIVDADGQPIGRIKDGDTALFFNFRTDRPRQLSHALLDEAFDSFTRSNRPDITFLTMVPYDKALERVAIFEQEKVPHHLTETLATHNLKKLKIAETEKYAHVTFFFNSQIETPFKGEDRILVPSAKVASYDSEPKMSAEDITEKAEEQIARGVYDFILINFANLDLVGHSGVKEAIIEACETVDTAIGRLVSVALENDYIVILTADHGNAEDSLYPDGRPKPSHSHNPVYFILVSGHEDHRNIQLRAGQQSDVAPTILHLMDIQVPSQMTGKTLIK